MPRHSASVQSTTTTTHSFVGLAQPTRPPTGVVVPPRARPVGRPDVGYSESCVMASEDSGAVDGGVGTFPPTPSPRSPRRLKGSSCPVVAPISRSRRCIPAFVSPRAPPWSPRRRLAAASACSAIDVARTAVSSATPAWFPSSTTSPSCAFPSAPTSSPTRRKTQQSHRAQCAILAPSQVTLCRPDHLPPSIPAAPSSSSPKKAPCPSRTSSPRSPRDVRPTASTRGPKTLPLDSPRSTPS